MVTVADLMTREGLLTLKESESLEDAGEYLKLAHIRHLPVVRHGRLVGLLTQRDWLRALVGRKPRDAWRVLVKDVMTRDVETVSPAAPVQTALSIMLDNKFGCVPVVDADGTLRGILTEGDLVRFAAERLRAEEHLGAGEGAGA